VTDPGVGTNGLKGLKVLLNRPEPRKRRAGWAQRKTAKQRRKAKRQRKKARQAALKAQKRQGGRADEWQAKVDAGLPTDAKSYAVYLQGDLWHAIRARVLRRDRGLCAACGGHATLVHHRSYEMLVLQGEDDAPLIALCHPCHRAIHITPRGRKRTPRSTERLLVRMGVSPLK